MTCRGLALAVNNFVLYILWRLGGGKRIGDGYLECRCHTPILSETPTIFRSNSQNSIPQCIRAPRSPRIDRLRNKAQLHRIQETDTDGPALDWVPGVHSGTAQTGGVEGEERERYIHPFSLSDSDKTIRDYLLYRIIIMLSTYVQLA